MANSVLDSNNNSQFGQALWQEKISQPYEYKVVSNFCNGAKLMTRMSSNFGGALSTPAGIEIVFEIQRTSYYLENILVRTAVVNTSLTIASSITTTSNFGLLLYQRIELRAHGITLWRTDPYNMQVRTGLMNFQKNQIQTLLANPILSNDGVLWTTSAFYVDTPIQCSLFDETYMYYDSIFQEQLQLVLVTETNTNLQVTLSSVFPYAYCWFRAVDNESYKITKALNFKQGTPSTILLSTTFTESLLPVTASPSQPISFFIKCKNVAQTTSFFMVDSTCTTGLKNFQSPTISAIDCIYKYDFYFAGQPIMSSMYTDLLLHDKAMKYESAGLQNVSNAGAITGTNTEMGPHTIYWSARPDRTYNSHFLAYYNGGQPILYLYTGALSTGNFSIVVVHDVYELMTIDTTNGQATISFMT